MRVWDTRPNCCLALEMLKTELNMSPIGAFIETYSIIIWSIHIVVMLMLRCCSFIILVRSYCSMFQICVNAKHCCADVYNRFVQVWWLGYMYLHFI